jgi:GT2 family glycosyltransferase
MAVYNGAEFIREQIGSILPQLTDNDELIIVDDASLDGTVAVIERFCDERIRIVRQERNCGVVQTFSHALEEARGEIIFLSDQDDVWRSDKVREFTDMFASCPDLTLALSDFSIIDATGNITSTARFKSGKFHPGVLHNLVCNRYQGSTMAFRRCILNYCLPFPADIPMHDMWIGIVNQFIGKTGFIGKPLVFYRRHGGNKSPHKHAPLSQIICWRWALIKNIVRLYVQSIVRAPKHE